MNIIKVECLPLSIFVGYERENDARGVAFDYSAWTEQYGDGVLQLLVQRPGDADPYPVVLTAGEDGTAVWSPSATDTAAKGWVEIQLIFMVGSVVAKTAVLQALVDRSLTAGSTPPDPYETWLETLTELAEQILHTTQPPEIRNGYWYIFDPDTGEYVNSGVKAEGEDGVGITGAQLNADYTLTLNFSDGTSYTTPSIRGAQGEVGPTPQLSVGTVTTGAAGSSAAVEITGTPEAPVLNFTIPRGDTGEVSEAELQAALLDKADVITDTASGAIASFPDGMAAPIKSLVCYINPVQDLHGYDTPWPAGGGANKLPPAATAETKTASTGFTVTSYADGHYHLSKTSAGSSASVLFALSETVEASSGMYFIPMCSVSNGSVTIGIKDASNNTIKEVYLGQTSPSAISTTGMAAEIYFFVSWTVDTIEADIYPMLADSNLTTWHPYSNECPIAGFTGLNVYGTGVNLFNPSTVTDNAYINSSGNVSSQSEFFCSDFISVKPNMQYYTNTDVAARVKTVHFFDSNKAHIDGTAISSGVITTPANCAFVRINGIKANISPSEETFNYPSTDTDYHAFVGTILPVSWQSAAGIVYAGYLSIDTNGNVALTGTYAPLLFDNSAWAFSANFFYKSFSDFQGKVVSGYYITENGLKMYLNGNNGQARIYLIDNSFLTSESDIGALLNGYKLLYKLATPVTIQLSQQAFLDILHGQNNIWHDANGDTSVKYRADTKLYIEKKITAAIAAALNS